MRTFQQFFEEQNKQYKTKQSSVRLNTPEEEESRRLDPKCWKGYRKKGTKLKGGVRVNDCVKV